MLVTAWLLRRDEGAAAVAVAVAAAAAAAL